eukprot:3123971-Amphidinium_carterae.1
MGTELEDDGDGEDAGEEPVQLARRRPEEPTKKELEEHSILHEPYRSWCSICVAGRALQDQHRHQDRSDDAIPTIAMDYAYLHDGDEVGDKGMPLLAAKDTVHRWYFGAILPSKGTGHPQNAKEIFRQFAAAGFTKVHLRSDGEPAIVDLKAK